MSKVPSFLSASGKIHRNCISGVYPASKTERQTVSEEKVKWNSPFPDYNPPNYTSDKLKKAPYADPEIGDKEFQPRWNAQDGLINRKSHEGDYLVVDEYPQNPVGRTGLRGRGKLGRWGPNHAGDPIVTRWKSDKHGTTHSDSQRGKRILQFVSIQRGDSGEWAFPGGMVDPGENVEETIRREFKEECMDSEQLTEDEKSTNKNLVEQFFKNGHEVYRGYVDDPRNTDNAWIETVAVNYHDETGSNLGTLTLKAGSDAKNVQWKDATADLKLHANHSEILQKVVERLGAQW
ncbi:ADP-ribose pyrophosphatase, mitochondrial-like [Paramacrobiotus metropolitanus]|uniref:ADP-ribose pyrophosphatase, mitochondrial-like n=1 Tax=Paramacrobiotus metropolitanus TaxID=2943436 RepID=UPI00244569D1|nr:ADP-ribose pyrophosphatase, mitochondrial-like [Paramacrobiotus metropolitanus]